MLEIGCSCGLLKMQISLLPPRASFLVIVRLYRLEPPPGTVVCLRAPVMGSGFVSLTSTVFSQSIRCYLSMAVMFHLQLSLETSPRMQRLCWMTILAEVCLSSIQALEWEHQA